MKANLLSILFVTGFALLSGTEFAGDDPRGGDFAARLEKIESEISDLQAHPDDARRAELMKQFDELWKQRFDLTLGRSNICPVHGIKMRVVNARVLYGMRGVFGPDPDLKTITHQFPFAETTINGGDLISGDSPKTGKVFVCKKCQAAEKAWIEAHRK